VGDLFEFGNREPAAVGCADESADAGSGDHADGDAGFFEDLENSDVGDTAGESASKGDADDGGRCDFRSLPGELAAERLYRPDDLPQTLHRNPTFLVCVGRKPLHPSFN
jgi:hypothetical protein